MKIRVLSIPYLLLLMATALSNATVASGKTLANDDETDLYNLLEKVTLDDVAPLYHDRLLKEADLVKLLDVSAQGQGAETFPGKYEQLERHGQLGRRRGQRYFRPVSARH